MSRWSDILEEVSENRKNGRGPDVICKKYVKKLRDLTGRNVIVYYSGWTHRQKGNNLIINDADMIGFMNVMQGMDCGKGLDLVLHTPGGQVTAVEAIVKYLRAKFGNNIRVIVPQLAMSAGTMMACAGKTIVMGKHSSLGPIDPQLVFTNGAGVASAYNIVEEFEKAYGDLQKNPMTAPYYRIALSKYPVAAALNAKDSIRLASELIKKWLSENMLAERNGPEVDRVVAMLNEHKDSKDHSRHFDINKCKEFGLVVEALEDDNNLQDAVLSVHHAVDVTMSQVNVEKIIINQDGVLFAHISK